MDVRGLLARSPALTIAASLSLLCGCIFFIVWRLLPAKEVELEAMVYFYDLNSGELFDVPADTMPPVETESGPHQGMPAGVRAHVFCCGDFKPGDEFFVGMLECPSDAVPTEHRPAGVEVVPGGEEGGTVVRRPTDDRWYAENSRRGSRIMVELRARCPEGKPLQVLKPLPRPKQPAL